MTTDPEGVGRSPNQKRRDKKKDRFRQRLKQGVNSEWNDNFVAPDPRDELELVALPTTTASQKIKTPVAGRPAMSLDRMRSARRTQDLGLKREKLIQKLRNDKSKRQQPLPSLKAEDDSDHGYLESGVNGTDSMLSSDGFSALEASTMSGGDSLGPFTMSDDVHDVTKHSNVIGDAVIDRQLIGLGSDAEHHAEKVMQNTSIQRSEVRQLRQDALTRVLARGRIQKSRGRSLGASSFETLDGSRHTLSDSRHDDDGEVKVHDAQQVEFSTVESRIVSKIQGVPSSRVLETRDTKPASPDTSIQGANVSFDTLDESHRSLDGSWNEVAGHDDPEMTGKPTPKMRSRLVAQGISRVRMRRSKDILLPSRDISNLNVCVSLDAPDVSRHNEREDPKSDFQKSEKPFEKMRRRLVGIGISRARMRKSMNSQLVAPGLSEQSESASFDELDNSLLTLDDSRHDELTKKMSPEPPRPESSVRTRFSRSLPNKDCEADITAPYSNKFLASDTKKRNYVTTPPCTPDEPSSLPPSNTTLSLESPSHDLEKLAEGGGSETTAGDEYQPPSHPSIGDGTRFEVQMTEQGISELDAPADEIEMDIGNVSNEALHYPIQVDASSGSQHFEPAMDCTLHQPGISYVEGSNDFTLDEVIGTMSLPGQDFLQNQHLTSKKGAAYEDSVAALVTVGHGPSSETRESRAHSEPEELVDSGGHRSEKGRFDAFLQESRPSLGDTVFFEHDAPADEKEMDIRKHYNATFRNSSHAEALVNESCAIAGSQYFEQTLDFVPHEPGNSSVEVGIDCPLDEVQSMKMQDVVAAKQPGAALENRLTDAAIKAAHGADDGIMDCARSPGKDSFLTDRIEVKDGADVEAEYEVSANSQVEEEQGLLLPETHEDMYLGETVVPSESHVRRESPADKNDNVLPGRRQRRMSFPSILFRASSFESYHDSPIEKTQVVTGGARHDRELHTLLRGRRRRKSFSFIRSIGSFESLEDDVLVDVQAMSQAAQSDTTFDTFLPERRQPAASSEALEENRHKALDHQARIVVESENTGRKLDASPQRPNVIKRVVSRVLSRGKILENNKVNDHQLTDELFAGRTHTEEGIDEMMHAVNQTAHRVAVSSEAWQVDDGKGAATPLLGEKLRHVSLTSNSVDEPQCSVGDIGHIDAIRCAVKSDGDPTEPMHSSTSERHAAAVVGESFDSALYEQGTTTQEPQGGDRRLTIQTFGQDSQEEVEFSTLASQEEAVLVCHQFQEVGTPPPPPPSKKRRSSKFEVNIVFDFSEENVNSVCDPSKESYHPNVGTPPPPPPPKKKKKKRRASRAKESSTSLDVHTTAPASTTDMVAEAVVLCAGEQLPTERLSPPKVKVKNQLKVEPGSPLLTANVSVEPVSMIADLEMKDEPRVLGLSPLSTKNVVYPPVVLATEATLPSNRHVRQDMNSAIDVVEGGTGSTLTMKEAVGPIVHAEEWPVPTQRDPPPEVSGSAVLHLMPTDEIDASESFPMSPGLLLDSIMFFKSSFDEPHVEVTSALAAGSSTNVEVTEILHAPSTPRSVEEQDLFYDSALLLKSSSECSEPMEASNVAWTKPQDQFDVADDDFDDSLNEVEQLSVGAMDLGRIRLDANTCEGSASVPAVEACQRRTMYDDFDTKNTPGEKEIKEVLRQTAVDGKQMFANDANGRNDEVLFVRLIEVVAPAGDIDDDDASDDVEASGVLANAPTVIDGGISTDKWDVHSIVAHPPESAPATFDCDAAAWDASRVVFVTSAIDSGDVMTTFEALDSTGPNPDDFPLAKISDCAEAQLDQWTSDVSICSDRDAAGTWNQPDFQEGWPEAVKAPGVDAQENEAVVEDVVALLRYQGAGNSHFPGEEEGRPTQSERIEAYNINVIASSSSDERDDDDSDGVQEVVQYVLHDADAGIGIDDFSERQDIIAAQFSAAGVATFHAAAAIAEVAESFVLAPSTIENQINGDLLALADPPLSLSANFDVHGEWANVNEAEKAGTIEEKDHVQDAVSISRDTDRVTVHHALAEGQGQLSPNERIGTRKSTVYNYDHSGDHSYVDYPDHNHDGIQRFSRNADAEIENESLSVRKTFVTDSFGTGVATFARAETNTDAIKRDLGKSMAGGAVQDFLISSSATAIGTPLNSLASVVEKRQIPLLAPPPEEKFKKWEEGKLAPLKLLEAMRNNAQTFNRPLDSPEKASIFDGQASDSHGEKSTPNGSSLAMAEGSQPESVISVESLDGLVKPWFAQLSLPLMKRLQMDTLRDGRSVDDDAGVELPSKTSSCDKSVHACDGKIVIGEKMAEMVAIANSVAAERLEECLVAKSFDSKSITVENRTYDAAFKKSSAIDVDPMKGQYYLSQSSDVAAMERGNHGDAVLGGAFSGWKDVAIHYADNSAPAFGMMASGEAMNVERRLTSLGTKTLPQMTRYENNYVCRPKEQTMSEDDLAVWIRSLLLQSDVCEKTCDPPLDLRSLLDDDVNFEFLCTLVAAKVSQGLKSKELEYRLESPVSGTMKELIPFSLASGTKRPAVLAANFVSFVQRIGKLTGIASPFKKENPFVLMVVGESMVGRKEGHAAGSVQQLVFEHGGADAVQIAGFFYEAVRSSTTMAFEGKASPPAPANEAQDVVQVDFVRYGRRYERPPEMNPSPFENAGWTLPSVVLVVIGFLGDPVAVCRMKIVNRFCKRIISENEHTVMRDAVRVGGMSMNVRPAFWLWVTLEKCGSGKLEVPTKEHSNLDHYQPSSSYPVPSRIAKLAQRGREGPWHGVIKRDVTRAFGNMPPHKTGAKLRADSIVRALVTFGHGRLIKRGVKGGGLSHPTPSITTPGIQKSKSKLRASTAPPPWEVGDDNSEASDESMTPTDTVSDWGGVSPVASFASSIGDEAENRRPSARRGTSALESQGNSADQHSVDASREATDDFVLNGNTLTPEMKIKLQNQLQFILHALAAEHEDVGYCQGMDYIVAHLLRVLQDTIMWRAAKGSLPAPLDDVVHALPDESGVISDEAINESLIVEEAVFRVMDCLFTSYNLRHIFWPELRSLKICCRVFERLVLHKLPVLADHFEHHELNVGLFALGWFQTLFLYLPSMPTATVCHIWDIWLVERSYKIFFRVGTAILFLSQPILLNHDLEGMMTYLNTFPDATLLKPDILIACALQIKVTNRMLTELEVEVTGGH